MKTQTSSASGFSLVELAIAASILFIVIAALTTLSGASDRAFRTGVTVAQLEQQAARVTDRIVDELGVAGLDTFVTLPIQGAPSDELEYLRAVGFVDGEVLWTAPRRLALEYEIGEVDDGKDNNRNGLIDECRVVLTENLGLAEERQLVLSRWVPELLEGELSNGVDDNGNGLVDEPGFCVERIGETFVVRLSLQRRDASSRLMSRTTSTSTRIRNRQDVGGGS